MHSRIYNIKKQTKGKLVNTIRELILKEWGIECNPALEWDHLCNQIDALLISDHNERDQIEPEDEKDHKEELEAEEVIPNPWTLLRNRELGQRLTWGERELIFMLHKNEKVPLATLQHRFQISLSTLKRIIAQPATGSHERKVRGDALGMKVFISRKIKKEVASYILSREEPFRSHDVWTRIQNLCNVEIKAKIMTKYMKTQLGLSFKRITSRPLNLDVERQHYVKVLFAVALTKRIKDAKLLINVDESTLSKETKNNYTWTLKGVPASAKNIKFSKSINLITAIWSSGSLYTAVTKGTTDSHSFKCYLERLINDVKVTEDIDPSEIWLILDNAPIHQANIILEYIESSKLRWVFLPQYCPELAPVETAFAILKQKAWMNANREIDLQSKQGVHLVEKWFQEMRGLTIRRLWARFYTLMRTLLRDVREL